MNFFDLHSHILPAVDDGAKSFSETKELIKLLEHQGVGGIVATPHFYGRYSSEKSAIKRVVDSYEKTMSALEKTNIPIYRGFEVHYFPGISRSDGIEKLTLNGSDYFLLEPSPSKGLSKTVLDEIVDLNLNRHLKPIIAHVERYSGIDGYSSLLELASDGFAILQVNADSLVQGPAKKAALEVVSSELFCVLSSDTHSTKKRPPRFDDAFKRIEKKLGSNTVEKLKLNSAYIFSELSK